ncbi:hypothetical protein Pfo_022414 [Paulownia fortunei]|nr:hypothetical protein Pfo_022414 [Paulownia fortunei]
MTVNSGTEGECRHTMKFNIAFSRFVKFTRKICLCSFCMWKCRLKEEPLTFGALFVLNLLPRLSEAWHAKRPFLVEQ